MSKRDGPLTEISLSTGEIPMEKMKKILYTVQPGWRDGNYFRACAQTDKQIKMASVPRDNIAATNLKKKNERL